MRRSFGRVLAVFLLMPLLATALAGHGVGLRVSAAQEISCADFNSTDAAQALLEADDSFEDALDPDGDGDACTDDDLAELEAQAEDPTAIAELEARFGSPRADFEDEYGDPTNDEDDAWPVGAEYDIDGFREVSVFYHLDYAAYITLSAERRTPFSQSEAEEIVLAFLPDDFEQDGQPEDTEDGDLLIPGHSDALEERFGPGTYERYGATGDPGDVSFILRLNADNDVSGIEIGLGLTEQTGPEAEEDEDAEPTPEPEDEEPVPDPADEDEDETAVDADEYVGTVTSEVESLLQSIDDFFVLIGSDDFGSDESIDGLTDALTLWAGAGATAADLTPPDGFEDAHELYIEFTDLLLTASSNFLIGISDSDDASITAAGEALNDAQTTGQTLLTVLEGA